MLKSVPKVLLIFQLVGTSADIWMVVYLTITTAEQIRCSHASQEHIIHSIENHCHSLIQSCPTMRSFSLCLSLATSLTNILAPLPLTQMLIIKLEETQGHCFISFPKEKAEQFN